jgi:hypothetical protein
MNMLYECWLAAVPRIYSLDMGYAPTGALHESARYLASSSDLIPHYK